MPVVPDDLTPLPDAVVETVRRAATTPGAYPGGLDRVLNRRRAHRRRRFAASASGVLVLAAITAGGVPLLAEDGPAGNSVAGTAAASSQQLLLGSLNWRIDTANRLRIGQQSPPGVGEVLPDGKVVYHQTPSLWEKPVDLPDGRLVGVVSVGSVKRLQVWHSDGNLRVDRQIRSDEPLVELVGATERDAYLRHGRLIIAHELATGRERPVLELPADTARPRAAGYDVRGDMLAVAERRTPGCRIRLFHLSGRRVGIDLRLGERCGGGFERPFRLAELVAHSPLKPATTIRFSPDGSLLAVSYIGNASDPAPQRIAVVETATGKVRLDQPVPADQGVAEGTPDEVGQVLTAGWGVRGMAWTDNRQLRVAWMDLPDNPDRIYPAAETLKTSTVTVP